MNPPGSPYDMGGTSKIEIALMAAGMALLAMIAFMLPMNKISRLFFLGQQACLCDISYAQVTY